MKAVIFGATVTLLSPAAVAHGTTVLYLVTSEAIVMLADSQSATPRGIPNAPHDKIVVLRDRFGIATGGVGDTGPQTINDKATGRVLATFRYRFPDWIAREDGKVGSGATIHDLSTLIADDIFKALETFSVLAIRDGVFRREEAGDELLSFYIAGYHDEKPVVYRITLPIDWSKGRVVPAMVRRDERPIFGAAFTYDAIAAATSIPGPERDQLAKLAGKELERFFARTLTAGDAAKLGVAMIELEATRSPSKVAKPVQIVTIPKHGRAKVEWRK